MQKILFIEDEPALQKTMGDFLRRKGYEVISALDGKQGLRLVKREKPDLVLLDLILPGLLGMDVLRALRSDPDTFQTPVIVLSNVGDADAVEKVIELNARGYLIKTDYSLELVLEKIESVLGKG